MTHDHCVACGQTGNLYQHHLIPWTLGGSDDPTNLITLCGSCHDKAHGIEASRHIRSLTRAALIRKKANGERTGQIPYGYKLAADSAMWEPEETEQRAVAMIKELNALGLSLREIAGRLDAAGYRPRGKAWYPTTVANILKAAA